MLIAPIIFGAPEGAYWGMNKPPHDEIDTPPLAPIATAVNDECFTVVNALESIPKPAEPMEPALA